MKVAFASARFFRLWTSFRWSWRSKPLARLKTRISSPTSTAYLLRQNTSSFGGVDFASKQKIDISCFCWQFFPLVFTHHLPMKVPVVICLCVVVFQTAKQLRHVMLGSVAVPRSLQLLSLRLKHATSRTDTTPEKKRQNSTNNGAAATKNKVEFLVQVQLQTHCFSTHKGFAKKVRVLMWTLPAKVKSGNEFRLLSVIWV